MTKDLLVESETATIVEDPDTTPMSVHLPTREEKILPKEEVEEKNHHQGREGVGMIDMNEDPHGEARIRKGRTSHQEDPKSLVWKIRYRMHIDPNDAKLQRSQANGGDWKNCCS